MDRGGGMLSRSNPVNTNTLAGKLRPGWFVAKINMSDVYVIGQTEYPSTIIECIDDLSVIVYDVRGLGSRRDVLTRLKDNGGEYPKKIAIKDFKHRFGIVGNGDLWGPFGKNECVRIFLNFDKLVKTVQESIIDGVALAKEVQGLQIANASPVVNAKNIQLLATAVVETTELREDPPEKEIAEIDKILLCNRVQKFYMGNKGWLHITYIVCASVIAAAGLWLDSGPTVVASMLISSMMEPIKGMATVFKNVTSVRSKTERFLFHLLTLVFDMCVCLGVGALAGLWAQQDTWGDGVTESFTLGNATYRYSLLELMSGKNVMGEGRKHLDGKVTVLLPGEMSGRTKAFGLIGAVIVAFTSAFALIFADKSQNKSALVGIGISASLLPPFVNAGMLWSFINSERIPIEHDFAYLGGISFALAWINIGIIVFVWGAGYRLRRWIANCYEKKNKTQTGRSIEMTSNPMRELTPLLF